jgi:hypothetical protein
MSDAVIVAILAAVGAFLGSAVTTFFTARIAAQDRREQRRKERAEFILRATQSFVTLFAQYEEFIQKDPGAFGSPIERSSIHARIVGQAIAEILAVNDATLSEIAINRLTPNMVEEKHDPEGFKKYGGFKNRNRNAMIDALKQLGILMQETIKG